MKSWLHIAVLLATTSLAPQALACEHYAGHMDLEGKVGNNRNIGEASAFLPVSCTEDRLLFTDLKFRADNISNREANIGLGARVQQESGIVGGYIYFDRKKSGETDKFYNQITTGAEWLADHWESRANVYIPLNGSKTIGSGVTISDPYLAGTGIFIDRGGFQIKETPMYGADAEIGFQTTENLWLYGGGFTFHGNDVPTITGARVRAKYDLTDKVSLNAEGQYDDERGRQGWLGARLSVPFGSAKAITTSRMTQSPVRDVDIVTQASVVSNEPVRPVAVVNPQTGQAQRVVYVDNSAATNGDGSLENPYNTLADVQSDLQSHDVIYIHAGNGTTTNQDQGLTINQRGVRVIGEATPFVYQGYLLRPAGDRPLITNTAPNGDGVTVAADDVLLTGFAVQGAERDGIVVRATNGQSAQNVMLHNLVATNNRMGVYIHGADGGAVSAAVEATLATNNRQHGFAVYDDTDNTFDVDLGGGGRSAGLNGLFGNTLEDLAIDYDGRTLSAQNNWWGQASGVYQAVPDGTNKPQIYYGAPINDGLVGHWTFDEEWTDDTYVYDRSGYDHHGTYRGGLSTAQMVQGQHRQGILLDGVRQGVIIAATPELDALDHEFSVVASSWLDEDAGIANVIYSSGRRGGRYWANYLYVDAGPAVHSYLRDDIGSVHSTTPLPFESWLNTAITRNDGVMENMKLYSGGQLTDTITMPFIEAFSVKSIGYREEGPSYFFMGIIDDVRVYNRPLSSGEIAEIHRMNTDSIVNFTGALGASPF